MARSPQPAARRIVNLEAFPGVLEDRVIWPFISGEQGNKKVKLKETGTKAILGNREHQDFDFGEQGKCRFFFQGNKGTGTHPPGRASVRVAGTFTLIVVSVQPYGLSNSFQLTICLGT